MAAVLACGTGAVLSHRSAAALWDLVKGLGRRTDVSTDRSKGGQPGIAVHRVRSLDAEDRTVHEGVPVTSVPRTLLDLAATVPIARLERAVEQAERLRLLDLAAIGRLWERSRGHRGLKALGGVLDGQAIAVPDTRSELERRFLDLCRDAGLPLPALNVSIAGFEVDAVWPNARLAVELDGYAFHGSRVAFERDRVRDAQLQLAGFRVMRVTDRRLTIEPEAVVRDVESLLDRL